MPTRTLRLALVLEVEADLTDDEALELIADMVSHALDEREDFSADDTHGVFLRSLTKED